MSSAGIARPMTQTRPRPLHDALMANRRLMIMAFAFSAAMSILALTTSFYMLQVYDRVLTSRSVETLMLLTVIAVSAIAVFGWLDSLRLRLLQRIGMRVADALGKRVLRAMVASASQTGGRPQPQRACATWRPSATSSAARLQRDDGRAVHGDLPDRARDAALGSAAHRASWAARSSSLHRLRQPAHDQRRRWSSRSSFRRARTISPKTACAMPTCWKAWACRRPSSTRWREQWIDSCGKSSVSSDRDSRLSSMSRAVRLLIQIFLLGTGALLILDLPGDGRHHDRASIIGARALAPIESRVATWKSVIAARLAWIRLDDLLEHAPKRDEGMALPAPTGRLQALSASAIVHPPTRRTILNSMSVSISCRASRSASSARRPRASRPWLRLLDRGVAVQRRAACGWTAPTSMPGRAPSSAGTSATCRRTSNCSPARCARTSRA